MTDAGFYIDSPDTRSYLREIRYKFTIEEEAYLVWQCRRITLEAKFAAWEEIIQTTPDSAVIGRPFGRGERVDSIHQFLRDYMALQKQRLTEFSQPGRWVYTARFFCEKTAQWSDLGHFFTFYCDCLDACREEIRKDSPGRGKIGKVKFLRYPLDDPRHRPWELDVDEELRPLSITGAPHDDLEEVFPSFWLNIPTPFRRGDIVWDPSGQLGFPHEGRSVPFVLCECVNWDKKAMLENGFSQEDAQWQDEQLPDYDEGADTSDMHAWGYSYQLETGVHLNCGRYGNYLNLEYYRRPLRGIYQTLQPLSQYVKHGVEKSRLTTRMESDLQKALSREIHRACREY